MTPDQRAAVRALGQVRIPAHGWGARPLAALLDHLHRRPQVPLHDALRLMLQRLLLHYRKALRGAGAQGFEIPADPPRRAQAPHRQGALW